MPDTYSLTLVNQSQDLFNEDFAVFQAPLLGAPPGVIAEFVSADDPNTVIQIIDNNVDAYSLVVSQTLSGEVTDLFQDTADKLRFPATHQIDVLTPTFAESYEIVLSRAGRVQSIEGTFTPTGGETVDFSAAPDGHGHLKLTIGGAEGSIVLGGVQVPPHGSSLEITAELAQVTNILAGHLI